MIGDGGMALSFRGPLSQRIRGCALFPWNSATGGISEVAGMAGMAGNWPESMKLRTHNHV